MVPGVHEELPDLSEIASPSRLGHVDMMARGSASKEAHTDGGSLLDESILLPDDEEGTRHPAASPISTVPNVEEAGTEAAWRATVLPILTTSSDMAVWEVSERHTAWLSASHIKLGVAGAGYQAFFII